MRQNGVRSDVRFPYGSRDKKSTGGKSQGYNARLDESLGARDGKKSQSFKARRDESKGMEKAAGKRAYSAVFLCSNSSCFLTVSIAFKSTSLAFNLSSGS